MAGGIIVRLNMTTAYNFRMTINLEIFITDIFVDMNMLE